jgi:hypothetical protein
MKDILIQGRTANAALAASILASAMEPAYKPGASAAHGDIQTANSSLFVQAHFSEPLTNYATGWRDASGLQELCDFIAPPIPGVSERYEHITYPNAEAFLSDVNGDDDLRAIGSDFKSVDYTSGKTTRTVPNRGLRIVLDWDRIKDMPNWQEFYTNMLIERILRNAARRKYALLVAAATDVTPVWGSDGSGDPDYDVANNVHLSGDASGVTPTSALWGIGAQLLRMQCYGASNTPKGYAGRQLSPIEASQKAGLQAKIADSRYQSGTSKSRIVGTKVGLFTSAPANTMDPSNFKTARANTSQGGLRAVYVRQLSVKQWEIVVEVYETEFTASTLGVRTISPTAS